MYTRLLFSLLTLVLLSSNCYAQQLESPTLYKYNLQVFNPAAIDITQIIPITCSVKNSRTILSASGRYRWIGNNFPNSPNSANFRAEVYPDLGKYASIKWGGFGIYDQAGPLTTGRMQATVAGLVPLFEGGAALHILSGGIGAGAIVRHINLSEIHFKDGLNVSSTAMSSVAPSISLGLFYTIINRQGNMYSTVEALYFGLSIPQIFELAPLNLEDGMPYIQSSRQYYFTAGAKLTVGNLGRHSIEPSIWVAHYDRANFQTLAHDTTLPVRADFNIRFTYDRLFWVGTGISTNKMLHTEFGIHPKKNDHNQLYNISFAGSIPLFWNNLLGGAIEANVTYSFDR